MEHGVSISPVAFLVIQENSVKLLPVCHSSALDKLLDYVPDLIEKTNNILNKQMEEKRENEMKQRKIDKIKKDVKNEREAKEENKEKYEDNIEEQDTDEISQITKVQPRKIKNKYDYEYDETEE